MWKVFQNMWQEINFDPFHLFTLCPPPLWTMIARDAINMRQMQEIAHVITGCCAWAAPRHFEKQTQVLLADVTFAYGPAQSRNLLRQSRSWFV
jgi:hypothetical protein